MTLRSIVVGLREGFKTCRNRNAAVTVVPKTANNRTASTPEMALASGVVGYLSSDNRDMRIL
jgi:hypothetical protein